MQVSRGELERLLRFNICEIRFKRRHAKPGMATTRRMLCTNSLNFLVIPQWQVALNYRFAKSYPKFNQEEKNVIITWDILMQDFRIIPLDEAELIQRYDASDEGFGPVFNKVFRKMSPRAKLKWMNS